MQDEPHDEPDNSPQPQHQSPEVTPISGDAHIPPTPVARINMERSYMGPISRTRKNLPMARVYN